MRTRLSRCVESLVRASYYWRAYSISVWVHLSRFTCPPKLVSCHWSAYSIDVWVYLSRFACLPKRVFYHWQAYSIRVWVYLSRLTGSPACIWYFIGILSPWLSLAGPLTQFCTDYSVSDYVKPLTLIMPSRKQIKDLHKGSLSISVKEGTLFVPLDGGWAITKNWPEPFLFTPVLIFCVVTNIT